MQNKYDRIHKFGKTKAIQAMMSLPQVKDDFQVALNGAKFIGSDTFGYLDPNEFILNKDLESYNITFKDYA